MCGCTILDYLNKEKFSLLLPRRNKVVSHTNSNTENEGNARPLSFA